MIRTLSLTLFFFFGPALLMFMLRNVILLLRIRSLARSQRSQPEVIDITPVDSNPAPRWFYVVAAVLGIASAVAGFIYLQAVDSERRQYVPAHISEQGEIVPGHWQSLPPAQ